MRCLRRWPNVQTQQDGGQKSGHGSCREVEEKQHRPIFRPAAGLPGPHAFWLKLGYKSGNSEIMTIMMRILLLSWQNCGLFGACGMPNLWMNPNLRGRWWLPLPWDQTLAPYWVWWLRRRLVWTRSGQNQGNWTRLPRTKNYFHTGIFPSTNMNQRLDWVQSQVLQKCALNGIQICDVFEL